MLNKSNPNQRLIRIKEVMQITGISKSYIYSLCSKREFPQSIQLVKNGSAVAWVEQEVLDWIDSRINARDNEVV